MDSELQHTVLVYSLHTLINKLLVMHSYLLATFLTWKLKIRFLQRSVVAFDGFFFIKLSVCCVCVSVSIVCMFLCISGWVHFSVCVSITYQSPNVESIPKSPL